MDQRFRIFLAELVGTFVVVLVGAGTVCSAYLPNDPRFSTVGGPVLAVALAEGLALAAVLSATFFLSPGCLNPAITVGLWVLRRIDLPRAGLLIAAQVVGAVLAGLAVRALFSDPVLQEARLGAPHLKALLDASDAVALPGLITGVALEAFFTFVVSLAAFATLFDSRAPRVGGLIVGLAQTAVILLGFHLTGGAANPVRWLGPAVWELTLSLPQTARPLAEHTVYWAGPIAGALLGCLFYARVILPHDPQAEQSRQAWR
jgi:glycerol uptake facilitator-like aquaporin